MIRRMNFSGCRYMPLFHGYHSHKVILQSRIGHAFALAFGCAFCLGSCAASPPAPPPRFVPPATTQVIGHAQVKMRDGVRLDAMVYVPAKEPTRFPVVLIRSPYKNELN